MMIQQMGARPGTWSPAPYRQLPSPYARRSPAVGMLRPPVLGQAQGILESPTVAFATATWTAAMSFWLAYGLGKVQNPWSTAWWVIGAASSVKALHDLGRMRP